MTIKNTIYSAHQRLEQLAQTPVKRSHVYELLAAALGFNTYASLTHQAILIQRKRLHAEGSIKLDLLKLRSEELGYGSKLITVLPSIIEEHRLSALTLTDLVFQLRNEDYLAEYDWQSDHSSQQVDLEICNALAASAKAGNSLSHYALALHYVSEDEDELVSDYWYKQMLSGRVLTSVEKDFAQAYLDQLTSKNKYELHLREAARLGNDLAQLDLAEKFDDHAFFEGDHRGLNANPMRVADIARALGRPEDYRYWLTVAAETGNVDAMRELIESHEEDDLPRSWTWIYLSQLLGKDLTQNNYYAIHEDGSRYDDNVGGAMFVDGEDGVDLPALESELDSQARANAEIIFKRINN